MMYNSFQQEYEPLIGSPRLSSSKQRTMVLGGVFLLVVGMLATMSSPVPAPTTFVAVEGAEGQVLDVTPEESFSTGQYDLVYNFFSFAIAAMFSATVFFFHQVWMVLPPYRTALVISGLVTLIAFYHYMRIFESFTAAYVSNSGTVTNTGVPFNDAYRYVDWLLTVPLLLIEVILVMRLDAAETRSKCTSLGLSAAAMIILGYPGEISDSMSTRWMFWVLAMIP